MTTTTNDDNDEDHDNDDKIHKVLKVVMFTGMF